MVPIDVIYLNARKISSDRDNFLYLINLFLSSANKCLLKVGAYCAQLEQYQKAIEIYEQVCSTCVYVSST